MDGENVLYTEKRLLQDEQYYTYIFKKTEKIVCAVFYTLRSRKDISGEDTLVSETEFAAQRLLQTALSSLRSPRTESAGISFSLAEALLDLESKLRVLTAAHVLSNSILSVYVSEIDSVLRSLQKYISVEGDFEFPTAPVSSPTPTRRMRAASSTATVTQSSVPTTAPQSSTPTGNRTERILELLKTQPQASIKDISDVITDCSEKTIQRELIKLIKDGKVVREGERRWSKYSVA